MSRKKRSRPSYDVVKTTELMGMVYACVHRFFRKSPICTEIYVERTTPENFLRDLAEFLVVEADRRDKQWEYSQLRKKRGW